MKSLLALLALFAGQAVTLQSKPVVHLRPHTDVIDPAFAGSLVELMRTPAVIHLPSPPPKVDASGVQWTVDVKNFGPTPVTVVYKTTFTVPVAVNETVHIVSDGDRYILKH
jgi:hypothetical protein